MSGCLKFVMFRKCENESSCEWSFMWILHNAFKVLLGNDNDDGFIEFWSNENGEIKNYVNSKIYMKCSTIVLE